MAAITAMNMYPEVLDQNAMTACPTLTEYQVLLNQLGPPRPAAEEHADVSRWATHLAAYPWVRDTIAFDAFARCWVLEHRLLEAIGAALPAERQAGFARLADAWLGVTGSYTRVLPSRATSSTS